MSAPIEPIERLPGDGAPEEGVALCLSGGGYRAMLFHLGALVRLNELGVLPRLARISSVSGGSITAGVLGSCWSRLAFTGGVAARFDLVVEKVRKLAGRTIDVSSILSGAVLPFVNAGDRVAREYRDVLFGDATLQDLPDTPRFVINATNVQSGALWRFSKPYMADWRVGKVPRPRVQLATAVAASSAFPPFLSPFVLDLNPQDFEPGSGAGLQQPPYTERAVLTDGGVYDNLGLETAWKNYNTVLAGDGGGQLEAEPRPHEDWPRHTYRVLELIDNQVRSLRKRQLIGSFGDTHRGTYWGIRSDLANYHLDDALPVPHARTRELADTPTRLERLDDVLQERLINWGYAVTDAAMRKHVADLSHGPAPAFPYPRGV